MNESVVSDYYSYDNKLDIEGLLLTHMNRIAIYRDKNINYYCSSVETHILNCPKKIRQQGFKKMEELGLKRANYSNINRDKIFLYDELYIYVNELLEKNQMIWRTKQVKTFE